MDEVKSGGHNGNNTVASSFSLRDLLSVVFHRRRLILFSFAGVSLSTFPDIPLVIALPRNGR
jgi:hypothetical protein